MSLMDTNGNLSAADVAAVVGNNRSNGGGMFGGYDGGWFWIVILFLFAMFGNNGWGNNGNNGGAPVVLANGGFGNNVQQVVDQQSVMNGLMNINTSLNNGFANAEVSRCNANMNTLQALNNIGMSLQNCCCENRANIADLKYTVATENCADRTAAQQNTRDIIDAINAKYQMTMDKICQLELDSYKQQLAQAQNENQALRLSAYQGQQTAQILADNAAQTVALEQYLDPTPKPAYIVANPNCCQQNYYAGCGCSGRRIA